MHCDQSYTEWMLALQWQHMNIIQKSEVIMCIKKYGHHFLGETLLCSPEYDPLSDEKRCWNSRTSAINNKLFMLGVFADGGKQSLAGSACILGADAILETYRMEILCVLVFHGSDCPCL